MSAELMQQNQEYEFEARNPRPGYKRLKAGDIFTWNLEVGEEVWAALKTLPDNAIIDVRFYYHEGDEPQPDESTEPIDLRIKAPRKKDAPKGEFSRYWQEMFKAGFHNMHDLQQMLECEKPEDVKGKLKELFNVTSLTFVSDGEFETWCYDYGLTAIITLSRQASAKVNTNGQI
jgi:hypothetical protein